MNILELSIGLAVGIACGIGLGITIATPKEKNYSEQYPIGFKPMFLKGCLNENTTLDTCLQKYQATKEIPYVVYQYNQRNQNKC